MSSPPRTNKLDVESEEQRQERLSKLFTQQLAPAPPTRPTTFAVEPPSELLSRLQAFLPQIATANEALAQRTQEELDIENVGEDEENYVEMDLGLGVFNAKVKEGEESDSSSSEEGSSSEEDEDEDDKRSEGKDGDAPSMLKLATEKEKKKGKKPGIEMLEDEKNAAGS